MVKTDLSIKLLLDNHRLEQELIARLVHQEKARQAQKLMEKLRMKKAERLRESSRDNY